MKKQVIIYTDGACSGNPGPGGWGVVLKYKSHVKHLYGSELHTTNNRMEILASIKALESLKDSCNISLFTDSIYLKEGISKWLPKWKVNQWKNSSKKLVKNLELWHRLDILIQNHEINWYWVKAHNGNPDNEMADFLATQGKEAAQKMCF